MSTRRTFVLDANVFIEAANRYYAFDLVPAFWSQLEFYGVRLGSLCSIDRVQDELHDQLEIWTREHSELFESTQDSDILASYAEIMQWAQNRNQYTAAAKAQFASNADGWLIAYARVRGHVVVTHEQPAPESKKRITIPDVCIAFRVPYCNTFEMLRELGIRLA